MCLKMSLFVAALLMIFSLRRTATGAEEAAGYLFPGYGRRAGHAVRFSLGTIDAGGYRICGKSGRACRRGKRSRRYARCGSHHGCAETGEYRRAGLRRDHALSRGSRRERGGTRECIPIRHFIDHGPYTVELQPGRDAAFRSYMTVREHAHASVAKPGDQIPVEGLDVQVVSSAGEMIKEPMAGAPGAGAPNPLCRDAKLMDQDPTPENFESVGSWSVMEPSGSSIWVT